MQDDKRATTFIRHHNTGLDINSTRDYFIIDLRRPMCIIYAAVCDVIYSEAYNYVAHFVT